MTTFLPFASHAALQHVATAPSTERDAAIAEMIVAPFQGMFAQMAMGGGSDAQAGYVAAAQGWQMTPPEPASDAYWAALDQLEAVHATQQAVAALERADTAFVEAGVSTNIDTVRVGIFPFHPDNPQIAFSGGYTGFGGIPGYIVLTLWPNDYTLPRIAPAAVHEFNHQLRFQRHPIGMQVSVGEYIVAEGLAESFAAQLFGEELVDPWVTDHTEEQLSQARDLIGAHIDLRGFGPVHQYVFGDETAAQQGLPAIGMPCFGGYAIGYQLVQAYLRNTRQTAAQATLMPAAEIITQARYW